MRCMRDVDFEFFVQDLKRFGDAIAARQLAHARGHVERHRRMEDAAVEIGFDLLEQVYSRATEEQYERVETQIRAISVSF